jgi:hypothetical protein
MLGIRYNVDKNKCTWRFWKYLYFHPTATER